MVVSVKKGTAQLSDKTATKKAIPLTQATTKKKASKKKEKILVTQLEHAHALLKEREARGPDWKPRINYLTGMRIYFYGGDLNYAGEGTRNKMRILVDRGATLLPTYDPETTTHIITNASKGTFLEAIGLRSLKDIPEHIPVLKWEWIISHRNGEMGKWYDYASFRQRVHWVNANGDYELFKGANQAKSVKGKEIEKPDTSKRAESEDAAEFSRISSFTQDKPAASRKELASHGPSASSSSAVVSGPNATVTMGERKDEDPLAAFYERARAELEAEELQGESDGNASDDERRGGSSSVTALKRGDNGSVQKGKSMFACDRKGEQPSDQKCPNQDVIDKLEELKALHDAKPSDGDHWRVFSYNKAVRALRSYPTRIRSYDEARKLFGVGDKTAQKIMEIIETGQLQRIQYERTEDIEITKLFTGIYGVGRSTAYKWYQNGCRTLEDLKNGKAGVKLSASQRIGIQFYDDINARMPRDEARQIFELIKPLALEIDPKLFVEIMGSYRRGKADCGDIDILITRPTDDGKTHSGVLKKLLAKCHERGIVTEDLNLPDDWMDLENCYRGLCRRDENSRRRRIDFLTVPYESRGAALLYYTGDDIFNRSMRMKANMMGYSLNQKGLYSGVVRNPSNRREKLNDGTIIASATEEEIFKVLGVPWHEPHERVRNRA
ncbi:hypothetical protein BXZ70DRAFT_951513 [Cristinia sonorae]|uniref:DNA polymerase n=1 Tax=Cristinia sonorae TaxID=1940300 RepID=A0A8K0UHI1_9AGAR|nr:hypothetical protein BXZ70DRAFT_951513 [Cristinia sonorae]